MVALSHCGMCKLVLVSGVLLLLLVGLTVGVLISQRRLHRHLADGFRYLTDLSDRRFVGAPDIVTAFAWPARRHRAQKMRCNRDWASARDGHQAS